MKEEIINRVANSPLITIDLEDFFPTENIILFDLKDWLFQGLLLKEKEFRQALKEHDWSLYKNKYVAIDCSTDAILPAWTKLLVSTYLYPVAKKAIAGNINDLISVYYNDLIHQLNIEDYENKKIILKGCSNKPVPESAYLSLMKRLQPIANSVMYGEACSTVPLYKKPRT